MNYEQQVFKQVTEQPAYIKNEKLLMLHRASMIRYERTNNTLNFMPMFFDFVKSITKDVDSHMSKYGAIQKMKLQTTNDAEIVELVTGMVRSIRALPLVLKQKVQTGLSSRSSILGARTTYDQVYHYFTEAPGNFLEETCNAVVAAMKGEEFLSIVPYVDGAYIVDTSFDNEITIQEECAYEIPEAPPEILKLEEIHTPDAHTIEDLANFTKRPTTELIKAVMYQYNGKLVFVNIRGDLEVSTDKLRIFLGIVDTETVLELASEELLNKHGLVGGFAGLVNMKRAGEAIIICDNSVKTVHSGVTGANKRDYHFTNFNIPRDTKKIAKNIRYGDVAEKPKIVKGAIVADISSCRSGLIDSTVLGYDSKPVRVPLFKVTLRLADIAASLIGRKKIHGAYIINALKTDEKASAAAAALTAKLPRHLVVVDNRPKANFGAKMDTAKLSQFDTVVVCSGKTDPDTVNVNESPVPIAELVKVI